VNGILTNESGMWKLRDIWKGTGDARVGYNNCVSGS